MTKTDYLLKSFINASAVFLYVLGIAWALFHAKDIFGEVDPPGFFIPVSMLLLFIISATITSLLVLGRPIYLYFNGLKKEAIILLLTTLGWLLIFLVATVSTFLLQWQ